MIAFFIFVDFVALNCTFSPPRPVTLKCAEIRKLYSLDVIKWCGVAVVWWLLPLVPRRAGLYIGQQEMKFLIWAPASSSSQQSWSRQFVAVLWRHQPRFKNVWDVRHWMSSVSAALETTSVQCCIFSGHTEMLSHVRFRIRSIHPNTNHSVCQALKL